MSVVLDSGEADLDIERERERESARTGRAVRPHFSLLLYMRATGLCKNIVGTLLSFPNAWTGSFEFT